MKKTTEEIVNVHRLLSNAKVTKLTGVEKLILIQLFNELTKCVEEYNKFLKNIGNEIEGDEFNDIRDKIKSGKELDKNDQEVAKRLDQAIYELLQAELTKEHEINAKPLLPIAFNNFLDSNDFSAGEWATIYNFMYT